MKCKIAKRSTIRFNDVEEAQLELFKKNFGIETDGEALKFAVDWSLQYLKFVTEGFFPSNYDVLIQRKRKTHKHNLKVYHK